MKLTKNGESSTYGAPLAVCVNDCMLDYGQPAAELSRICFQVKCAFAEMRWGCSPTHPEPPQTSQDNQPASTR